MTSGDRIPLAGLWGEIQAAVRERVTTADLWQRANAAAQSRGFAGVTGSALEMGQLRSIAARVRDAAINFARAAPEALIDTSMFAPDINAQSITGRTLTPVYRVRFQQSVATAEGQIVDTFRTVSFPVSLPSSKSALLAELLSDAEAMAEIYGEQSLGVGAIEISVV